MLALQEARLGLNCSWSSPRCHSCYQRREFIQVSTVCKKRGMLNSGWTRGPSGFKFLIYLSSLSLLSKEGGHPSSKVYKQKRCGWVSFFMSENLPFCATSAKGKFPEIFVKFQKILVVIYIHSCFSDPFLVLVFFEFHLIHKHVTVWPI